MENEIDVILRLLRERGMTQLPNAALTGDPLADDRATLPNDVAAGGSGVESKQARLREIVASLGEPRQEPTLVEPKKQRFRRVISGLADALNALAKGNNPNVVDSDFLGSLVSRQDADADRENQRREGRSREDYQARRAALMAELGIESDALGRLESAGLEGSRHDRRRRDEVEDRGIKAALDREAEERDEVRQEARDKRQQGYRLEQIRLEGSFRNDGEATARQSGLAAALLSAISDEFDGRGEDESGNPRQTLESQLDSTDDPIGLVLRYRKEILEDVRQNVKLDGITGRHGIEILRTVEDRMLASAAERVKEMADGLGVQIRPEVIDDILSGDIKALERARKTLGVSLKSKSSTDRRERKQKDEDRFLRRQRERAIGRGPRQSPLGA